MSLKRAGLYNSLKMLILAIPKGFGTLIGIGNDRIQLLLRTITEWDLSGNRGKGNHRTKVCGSRNNERFRKREKRSEA